jgi:hypothetical protein
MAREAAVRLTLSNAQFVTSIKRAGDEVDKVGKKGQKSFDLFGAAAGGARKSIMNLGGAVKNVLALAGSLGGAFTVGSAIKGALDLQRAYRQIAFGVRDANGRMLEAAAVQKTVERSAAATGQANADMATSFRGLIDATGDVDFARDTLDALGHTSMATGAELSTLVMLADQLHTKFGVAADQMQTTFAQVFANAKKGGPSFAEFSEVMGSLGAEMLAAGLTGKRGLDFMLGTLAAGDDAAGGLGKQVRGLKMLLRGLGDADELKKLSAKLAIDPKKLINEKDAVARLRMVFGKGKKGIDALLAPMGEGEEKQTLKTLFTDPFEKALSEANASGLEGKAAIDRALQVFDQQIGEFGKANMSAADMLREAELARRTPEAQLNAALNTLSTAFGDPAIISAINDLAEHLPALAKVFGEFVGFAAKNPLLSGTLALGGKVGAGALSGAAGSIFEAHRAGGAAVKTALGEGGVAFKGSVKDAFGSVSGVLATAGQAFGIAAAAYLAFKVGQEQIDNHFAEQNEAGDKLRNATLARKPRSAAERDKQIADIEAGMKGTEGTGAGVLDTMLRGAARVGAVATGSSWDAVENFNSVPDSRAPADQDRADAREQIERLRQLRFGETTLEPRAAMSAAPGKRSPEGSGLAAGRTIGAAMATALGGQVLTVRIANPREVGIPVSSGSGSRGPMAAGSPRPGGAV